MVELKGREGSFGILISWVLFILFHLFDPFAILSCSDFSSRQSGAQCRGMSTALALPAASGPSRGGQKVATGEGGGGGSPSVPGKRRRREELLEVVSMNVNEMHEEGKGSEMISI